MFSVTLGDLVIPADADSVVEFNITHRTVRYQLLHNLLLFIIITAARQW